MIYPHYKHKPSPWALVPGLVDPRHLDLWRDCVLAIPFWQGGKYLNDAGPHHLDGYLDTELSPITSWVATPYGVGIRFTGTDSDSRVVIADPPSDLLDGTNKLSLEVLFRPSVIDAVRHGLIGKYNTAANFRSWRFYIDADELALQVSTDGAGNEIQITTAANLVAGTWYRAVATFDAGVFKVWLDGKPQAVDANFAATTIFAGNEPFWIGTRSDALTFTGDIASVRVWRGRALSAQDVQLIEDAPWAMYDPPLFHPSLAVLHSGGAAPGPWMEYGQVAKGVQELLLQGLVNGTSYDVQIKTVDMSGNVSAGNTLAAATPVAGAKAWLGRFLRRRGLIRAWPGKKRPR